MSGKVILVGAGPGDPGLLTIKGEQAIKSAEVVVCDRLVSKVIEDKISPNAEKINVGKRASYHPVPQDEINQILVQKALEGKRVVRLKGGDPFLFGRGGEELEVLVANGIEFEVIPGVTSAISVPGYAGIPVTHRDFCSSVHIITGHAKAGKELEIDYEALVRTKGTLVFLMGVKALEKICQGLIAAGMNPNMPAAIVEDGTLTSQRKIISTVNNLSDDVKKAEIKSPAISIVGEVCTLDFDWFSRLPLNGKTVVVTRPKERAGTLTDKLRQVGADVLEYECIEIQPIVPCPHLDKALDNIKEYEWIVFTSPAGVKISIEHMFERGLDCRALGDIKVAAIGSGTEKELKKYGLLADLVPDIYNAEELGKKLTKRAKGKVLILRAEMGSPNLTRELDSIKYDDIAIYQTFYRNKNSVEYAEIIQNADCVTFTSASTVKGFVKSLGEDFDFSCVYGICIGQQTAQEAKSHGIKTVIAPRATIDDMVETILLSFEKESKQRKL